jgi:hypothetical protein
MNEITPVQRKHWMEYVVTSAVLVISAISLWVAIGTEDANRRMVAASSWPFLQMQMNNLDQQGHSRIDFYVVNSGVGPAKIESFQVFLDGKAYSDPLEYMHACCGLDIQLHLKQKYLPNVSPIITGVAANTVLRAGEARSVLSVPLGTDNGPLWHALDKARSRTTFRACYCSVFDECWLSNLEGLNPKPIDKCPIIANNFPS